MGWLSRIFKGSHQKAPPKQCDLSNRGDRDANHASTSQETWCDAEDVTGDAVLSASEEEEDQIENNVADDEAESDDDDEAESEEDDEQLAQAFQSSVNIEAPTQQTDQNNGLQGYDNRDLSLFNTAFQLPYAPNFSMRCTGCGGDVANTRILNFMGAIWHYNCLNCQSCNQPIIDGEFSVYGNFRYHKQCFQALYIPKCVVCKDYVPSNEAGTSEYRTHPFWYQKYCPFHDDDGTRRCCSCERMETPESRYVALDDGRNLCMECMDSAIMDSAECNPLYLDIQDFFEGLSMKLEQKIPLMLVERQALNEAIDLERNGHRLLSEIRGLCLYEEEAMTAPYLMASSLLTGNPVVGPYRLIRFCEITAFIILYGFPRLLTGSILAHEMMHAWLRLRGYRTLSPEVEEGICQVLSHMWLESQLTILTYGTGTTTSYASKPVSPYERRLGEFFKYQIETDASHVYGNGYRAGRRAVLKYGLQGTLDHMAVTGTFPY